MYVYDSLYSEVNKYTEEIIATICGGNVEVCCFQDLQKQEGTNDYGLYCIAMATSLLHNKYPLKFDQSLLRQHLIFCFEKFVHSLNELLFFNYIYTNSVTNSSDSK